LSNTLRMMRQKQGNLRRIPPAAATPKVRASSPAIRTIPIPVGSSKRAAMHSDHTRNLLLVLIFLLVLFGLYLIF